MALPSDSEQILVNELRSRLTDLTEDEENGDEKEFKAQMKKDDMFLVRWIRARDNDVDRAEEMLRSSIKWRIDNSITPLRTKEIPKIYEEKYPRVLSCHTKQGLPVITVPFGTWDVPYTVATTENQQNFNDYTLQGCELLMDEIRKADAEQCRKNQRRISQCVILIDMAGFSFMSLLNVYAVQNGLSLLSQYEANYPETLHSAHLINCGSAINMLLNLVKGVLAERTYNKIKVYGTDLAEWKGELTDLIDAAQLPVAYGGLKEEGDEVPEEVGEELGVVEVNANVNSVGGGEEDEDDVYEDAEEAI